jgi:hypothetical protein
MVMFRINSPMCTTYAYSPVKLVEQLLMCRLVMLLSHALLSCCYRPSAGGRCTSQLTLYRNSGRHSFTIFMQVDAVPGSHKRVLGQFVCSEV